MVHRKILKKEAFPQFTVMKKFLKFWFQQDGAKAHMADLTLDLVETHFKKRVISNCFPLKKKRAGAGHHTAQSQSFVLFLLGLCKGPVLCKQTDNDFGSAKKISPIFSTHFERIWAFSCWLPRTSGGVWSELWRGRVDTSKIL